MGYLFWLKFNPGICEASFIHCYFGWNLAWPSTDTQQIHCLNRKKMARRTRWGKATRPSLKLGKTEKEGSRRQVVLEKSRSSVFYSVSVFCSYFQLKTPHIYTNVFKTTQKSSLPSFQSEGKKIWKPIFTSELRSSFCESFWSYQIPPIDSIGQVLSMGGYKVLTLS